MRTSGASIGVAEPALVFIGFMGSGKTTALAAARDAGLETTEVDDLMAADLGMPIAEAFEQLWEESFRAREAEVVGQLLEGADGGAIALGGGSVLSRRVRDALARHVVVWLQVDAAEAWRRIEGSERPLARSGEDVERLLAERLPLYESLADAIVMPADAGVAARALSSIGALADLPDKTKLLWAASESGDYPVFVGEDLLGREWWPLEGRRFCVSDKTVARLYGDRVEPAAARIEVEPGEHSKTLNVAERVLEELTEAGMLRSDHVVALGGGVVGDLAGFCAHTYQRGVPVIQVPTTLVAQVDSAYGGKTGVDLPQAKNYVGAYHLPAAVIADVPLLTTLPQPEIAAGFVEVLKTSLLAGGPLWSQIEAIAGAGDGGPSLALAEVVFACARYKCEVVAADERDTGLRQVLNLGHTVGHAIEAATVYRRFRHGEAVGLGLLAALRLSDAPELRDTVREILARFQLPTRLEDVQIGDVMTAVERDKKRTAEGVLFVLLSEPGKPRPGQLVDPARVREAVEELAS
jgi:shikimate kinase/3-dehydroquinate synthase